VSEARAVLEAVRAGCNAAVGTGRPEAVLREHVQPTLESALSARGLRSSSRDELVLAVPNEAEASVLDAPLTSSGRIDAVYNRFVIEFEPPGSLRPSVMHSATRHAVTQVQQYLRGLSKAANLPLSRLAGCAFDGSWIVYVVSDAGEWRVSRPRTVDLESLEALLETLQSLASGRGLTADNLYEDFGPTSAVATSMVPLLASVFSGSSVSPRAAAFLAQWKMDLGNAAGLPSSMDIPDWYELCELLGVSSDDASRPQVLFALQTYFGIVAKLISLVVLEGATGRPLLSQLTDQPDVWDSYSRLEAGHLTASIGALNAIEPGIFSWYLAAKSEELAAALRQAAKVAAEYSAEVIEITALAARDVMKHLFQRLLPRSLRHRLGEYYTPDWLAEFVLDKVGYDGDPRRTLLDPACGSGTFLVAAISRIRAWYEEHGDGSGLPKKDLLQAILIGVTGFDLSPLAVMAARTNYLIAVRDLLRTAESIELPVFLCDSILMPTEYGDLFTGGHGKVLELKTSVGRFLIPEEVAHDRDLMASFADILQHSVDMGHSFGAFLKDLRGAGIRAEDETEYSMVYDDVSRLAAADIDGIWAHIIGNSFAATMQSRVDYVVGNPPWVFWNTLPLPYRDDIKAMMVDVYGLAAGRESTMRRLGSGGKDISALFTYVAMDRYLKDDGKLGFVITQTLFQTTAADEFRRWRLPGGIPIRIDQVDDWVAVRPFKSAANKTATLVATRGKRTSYPVKYRVWTTKSPFDRDHASLVEVLDRTNVREAWAHPSNGEVQESFWVISDNERPADQVETSQYEVRRGVETGLESAFRVRVLGEVTPERVTIENIRDRAKIPLPGVECELETALLHPYITGAGFIRWRARAPGNYVVPHTAQTGMKPIPEAILKSDYPLTYAYCLGFRKALEKRGLHKRWGKSNPFYALYDIGTYTFAPWKVVWKRSTRKFEAAVVSVQPVTQNHSAIVVPSGNVMMVPFEEPIAAYFLCGLLNNSLARARINSSITTKAHADIVSTIPLPAYDSSDPLHVSVARIAERCADAAEEEAVDQLVAGEEELDQLVMVLWGATSDELAAAHKALSS
jgi:SAM-dependent methyltransferase